ncbi:MAG: hypothetical protein ACO394_01075 [Blastocatellia bacterium]
MATRITITTDEEPKKPSSNWVLRICLLLLILGAGVVLVKRPHLLQMGRPALRKLLELILLLFKALYTWLPD